MGDVAHLSRCIDIATAKASTISSRSKRIAFKDYINLARNISPLRSWANYIRLKRVAELKDGDYEAIGVGNIRRNLDDTFKHIEAANTILNSVQEDGKLTDLQSAAVAHEFDLAGQLLEILVDRLPPSHRAKDLIGDSFFKQDVAKRPIRTMYVVCVKTLTLMADLEAKFLKDGKKEKWGIWRDQEDRLRVWGLDRIDGQAPFDSYIEIGDNEDTEDDAQFLYDAFSIILCIQCQSSPADCFPSACHHTDY